MDDEKQIKWVAVAFRCFHIGLCVFMCVTAVFSLSSDNDIGDTDSIFVAVYVFLFAASLRRPRVILFVFEISRFKSIPPVEVVYTDNFGFLYKQLSKAAFLVFIGFLQFGLSGSKSFTYSCGIITIANGVVLSLVYCKDSTLLDEGPEKYKPPVAPTARSQEV
ncbi:hypothetical protein CTAYLR_000787 [Chrysophaeum taylorii]|uniref:Uncharacterized protein n=1 Tax=Chrysophaeum taylorii TaxID=2483200 RepID=A0AAD7UQX7_9STRA|nr:hypothetical protein CTAYLR_000787 [Chrysophaeum taylorii]